MLFFFFKAQRVVVVVVVRVLLLKSIFPVRYNNNRVYRYKYLCTIIRIDFGVEKSATDSKSIICVLDDDSSDTVTTVVGVFTDDGVVGV